MTDFSQLTLDQQIAQLNELQTQQFMQQQDDIKARKNQLAVSKQQGGGVDPNFLPLAAVADALSGGKSNLSGLASVIGKQESDRKGMIGRLENSIANQEQALGSGQRGLLKTLLNERLGLAQLDAKKAKAGEAGVKLSGEQTKQLFLTEDALSALDDLETSLFQQKPESNIFEKAFGIETDRLDFPLKSPSDFVIAREQFVEFFGRAESGAAITKDEEKLFARLIPTAKDNPRAAKRKIAKIKGAMKRRQAFLRAGGVLSNATKFTEANVLETEKKTTPASIKGMTRAQKLKLAKERGLL